MRLVRPMLGVPRDRMSVRELDRCAIARAAVTCTASGSEREALRIAINLDEVIY